MAFSGYAAQGGMLALEDLFKRQAAEEAMRAAEEQRAIENERIERQMAAQEEQVRYGRSRDVLADKRYIEELERKDRERRDNLNRWGVDDMLRQSTANIAQNQELRAGETYTRELAGLNANLADPTIPEEAKRFLRGGGKVTSPTQLLDPKELMRRAIEQAQGVANAQAWAQAAAQNAYEPYVVREGGKNVRYFGKDAALGREVGDSTPDFDKQTAGGADATAKGLMAEAMAQRTERFIDLVTNESAKINTISVPDNITKLFKGPYAVMEGWSRERAAQAGIDPTVANYMDSIKGFIPILARAVGHVGVLTQQDVESALSLLPLPGISAEQRADKLAKLKTILGRMPRHAYADLPLMPQDAARLGIAPNVGQNMPSQSYLNWVSQGGIGPVPMLPPEYEGQGQQIGNQSPLSIDLGYQDWLGSQRPPGQ